MCSGYIDAGTFDACPKVVTLSRIQAKLDDIDPHDDSVSQEYLDAILQALYPDGIPKD